MISKRKSMRRCTEMITASVAAVTTVAGRVGDTALGTREANGRLTGDGASSAAWIDDGVVTGIRGHPGARVAHWMTLGTGRFFFLFFFSLDHHLWGVSTGLMWTAVVGRTDFTHTVGAVWLSDACLAVARCKVQCWQEKSCELIVTNVYEDVKVISSVRHAGLYSSHDCRS